MSDGSYFGWAPRRSAAGRRADAARRIRDASARGEAMSPVAIAGRTIARTFWGKAWCDNLERYRDFAYRLERGRSYLRSGSVIDLQIGAGQIEAKVLGSSLYRVAIEIDAVAADAWRAIRRDCAGSIGSRVDLLAGTLSDAVMARLCADRIGLFPAPSAIRFTCSCPDYASMCKHVAAAMYGVGARLDHAPELLFALRRVSVDELVTAALSELPTRRPGSARVLAADGLAAMFGIELADPAAPAAAQPPRVEPRAPSRHAQAGRAKADRAKAGRAQAGRAKTGRAKAGRAKTGHAKAAAKPKSAVARKRARSK